MNRRMGFERRRADGLRYPRRAILYVRVYWLQQRRGYAAGGSVLECGHADTVHQKGAPTREMARTHMRCRFCDPIARLAVVALAAFAMLLAGCSGEAFTAGELGAGDVGGSSSSAAGAPAELAGAPAELAGGTGGAPSTSEGGSSSSAAGGVAGSSSSSGAAGAADELCGCKNGSLSNDSLCPGITPALGCFPLICVGDSTNHCFQVCDGVCR